MGKKGLYLSKKKKQTIPASTLMLACAVAFLGIVLLILLLLPFPRKESELNLLPQPEPSRLQTEPETVPPTLPPTLPPTEPTEPEVTEPQILPELAEIYEDNSDLAGWITIEGTVIDYPVMYTPEDGEKYLYRNLNGQFDINGLPILEDGCSLEPESDNLIIYGHNMSSGAMFASLMNYAKEEYWESHPTIQLSTLYENREYEVIAAFYDRVYYKYEDCFKFYQFIDAEDEAHYSEAISYFKEKSVYDTGISSNFGDKLLTLVTCAYHTENGRFVVVARYSPDPT